MTLEKANIEEVEVAINEWFTSLKSSQEVASTQEEPDAVEEIVEVVPNPDYEDRSADDEEEGFEGGEEEGTASDIVRAYADSGPF